MASQSGVVCAVVVLLLGLAGCQPTNAFVKVQEDNPVSGEPLVAGSLETVADRTQAMLKGLGFNAVVSREADTIRLECSTDKGKHFALVLERWVNQAQESTRVRLEWQDGSDDVAAVRVLAGLSALTPR
jgi:hypothetical protein